MGWIYSKGVSAYKYVFKQLKGIPQQLLGSSSRDDSFNDGLISDDNEENVAGSCLNYMMESDIFLKPYNGQCSPESVGNVLLRALGVSGLQEKQVSILSFEEKPQSEQEDILIYLYMNWHHLQTDASVIDALKETNFVTSAGGDLRKPKDLFDPGDALLTLVFSGVAQKFPEERFASYGWLNILRKAGLRNAGDADIVLECARRVELLGAESMRILDDNNQDFSSTTTEVSSKILSLAETLIMTIIRNFDALYGQNFCNIFGKIACIPAEKGYPFDHGSGKKDVKRVLCSYSEAILLKDWPLAWRTAPIIYKESLVPPEYSWGALQFRSPPPFTVVLKHLKAHDFFSDCDSSMITVEEAAFEILQYLDRFWDTLSPSDVSELDDVSFIPVGNGTCYTNPFSIFLDPTIDLFPLAFILPPLYLPFVRILKEMGLQDVLSISSAISILSDLQSSCGNHPLNPNELCAVMKILHFVCKEITEKQNSDRSEWETFLVFPDDSCRLVDRNSCVYMDPRGSQYVKYIDSSKLRFIHRDVSERLCLAFGIRKLSDVVVEELDSAEHIHTLEEIGSVSLAVIRQKLLSRSFQVAVSRVYNTILSCNTGSENPNFQKLKKSLELVAQRLQFVQCICTRFWLLPQSLDITHVSKDSIIPEWESGSSHRALYYVDRSNTCMLISKPPSYVTVLDLVTAVVSHVLGVPVPLPIGSLFLCPHDYETALVDILKLSTDETVMDGVGSDTGFLGRDILPHDTMQLQLKPSRPFHKGEIVAWKCQDADKLKYGRIPEDVRPSVGQALYRFNIETSPGKIEAIISSHVFSFRNLSSGHVKHEDGGNVVSSTRVKQPEGVKMRNQGQPIKELEHGRVSAVELIQVVEEIMSCAGIRMDTKKQYLLQRTLFLQERLKESQATLLLEQKSKIANTKSKKAKTSLLCRICMYNEIDITIIPCGHVMCDQCSCVVSHCPFCRVQLLKTIKMKRR